MIATTLYSTLYYLLPYVPDFGAGFGASMTIPSERNEGLTKRSGRRALARKIRVTDLTFRLFLHGPEAPELRAGMRAVGNTPVLCPFWPGAARFYTGETVYAASSGETLLSAPDSLFYLPSTGVAPYVDTSLRLTVEPDMSAFEVHTGPMPSSFVPSNMALRVPILIGYLDNQPEDIVALNANLSQIDITFQESSATSQALQIKAQTFVNGPTLAWGTPTVFPLNFDWSDGMQAGDASFDVARKTYGQRRQAATAWYAAPAVRSVEGTVTCRNWEDTARLIRFFVERKGAVQSFWSPVAVADCRLSAPAGGATVSVDYPAGIGSYRYFALGLTAATSPVFRKVTAVDLGAKTLTLDSDPGALTAGTPVSPLLLTRFTGATLQLKWTGKVAAVTVQLTELPPEITAPEGETIGSTLGALPDKGFLFRFSVAYPDETIYMRFTSWENDLTWGAESYVSNDLQSGDLTKDVNIEKSSMKITGRVFPGNPLLLLVPNTLEAPLLCEVFEGEPQDDGTIINVSSKWLGKVNSPNFDGPFFDAKIDHWFTIFSRQVPRAMAAPGCQTHPYSASCGLLKTNWRFDGTIVNYTAGSTTLVIGGVSRNIGSTPTLADHWFFNGWMELGSGLGFVRRTILDSTAPDGSGHITLSLGSALPITPSGGSALRLYPLCDRTRATCKAVYDNYENYRGFDFRPVGNPALTPVKKNSGSSKK